jgi:hypothetical protein
MRALGRYGLPPAIVLRGVAYRHAQTVKHDFFAATGFYQNEDGDRVVLKVGRVTPFAGIEMEWVGRWLCRRELRFYRALAELPNVPRLLGTVGKTGFVHAFVPGQPLRRHLNVPDGYFGKLQALMGEIHSRRIAYVDANKSPNILVGDDGQPYLIDFQISWDLHELGNTRLNRCWLRRLQREDRYHILKHKRRLRPHELTPEERQAAQQPSFLIRLHRLITRPYFRLRRTTFKRLRASGKLLPDGSA